MSVGWGSGSLVNGHRARSLCMVCGLREILVLRQLILLGLLLLLMRSYEVLK